MKHKPYFTKLIQTWGIILVVGVSISIMAIDILGTYRDFNRHSEHIRTNSIARQKQIIKQEVMRVISLIDYKQSQSASITRNKLKSRVDEAFSIAKNIYQQNNALKSKDEVKKMILDALRNIRFENESGYYFAVGLDGTVILSVIKPELEGSNSLRIHDSHGQAIVQDMINIINLNGEGFYEYYSPKPGDHLKKISFIKLFEPYDWCIGAGLYVKDITAQIKTDLLSDISRIRFGEEGYIFVNTFNGDALVSNGKFIGGTKKLWEIFNKNPEKTKQLYEMSHKAALTPEGDYVYYSMVKLTDPTKESPKTSFIYGVPEYQWYVGAGVYLDDVESKIIVMQQELHHQIKVKIFCFSLIALAILLIFLILSNQLTKRLTNDFKVLISFFKNASRSHQTINRDLVQFYEHDQLAAHANKMLEDKIQAEHEKEDLTKKLHTSQKMKSIGLMAGGVAHDLNNILSGIVAYPELILQNLDKESDLRKPIEAIQQSGQRAATVVDDLLTVARGAASIRETHQLNTLINEHINSLECENQINLHSSISYEYHLTAIDSTIVCSPVHVKKCLMNLMINASEAITDAGTIVISTRNQLVDEADHEDTIDAGNYVVLSVEDTGSGIDQNDLEHIFEPFYTKKVMGRSGTGLGLAVVWNTMEDHDGKVFVESSDQGTRFELFFPIATPTRPTPPDKNKINNLNGNNEHILIVDDESQLRDIAHQMLTALGYKVDAVSSGELAIEFVKASPVDLIVLDMLMEPGITGRESYEQIIKIHPGQKAIIASGFSESKDVQATIKLGASGFIKKPYSMSQLGMAVKNALNVTAQT